MCIVCLSGSNEHELRGEDEAQVVYNIVDVLQTDSRVKGNQMVFVVLALLMVAVGSIRAEEVAQDSSSVCIVAEQKIEHVPTAPVVTEVTQAPAVQEVVVTAEQDAPLEVTSVVDTEADKDVLACASVSQDELTSFFEGADDICLSESDLEISDEELAQIQAFIQQLLAAQAELEQEEAKTALATVPAVDCAA